MCGADHRLDCALAAGPVLPVFAPQPGDDAVAVAEALAAGGIGAVEIALRHEGALACVRAVARALPQMLVGVGSVREPAQLDHAGEAGAVFAVSPGSTERLLVAAGRSALPLLPGVASPSDLMRVMEWGFATCKLFPAADIGGTALLRSLAGPFPDARFCPTGGITAQSAPQYLSLANVRCVGGSWLTPRGLVADRDWAAITRLAELAQRLPRSAPAG